MEFGEYLCEEILKAVPHRHFILSIPKILRRYFLYDRSLLSDLSRCGWESLKAFFQETLPEEDAVPGAVIAIQSFGDFLGFNSHLHVLASDGCFYGQGMFRPALARLIRLEACNSIFGIPKEPLSISRITRSGPGVAPRFETKQLDKIFRHNVFKMLLSKGKITEDLVNMLVSWPPARKAYGSESVIPGLTPFAVHGFSRVSKSPWKIWLVILSEPLSHRRG